jgi:myotubularin-related protein 1/2
LSNVDENSLNYSSSLPVKNNTQSSLNSQGIHTYNITNTTVRDSSFFIDRESIKNTFDLLRGETIIDYDEAYYRFEDANLIGTIVMTDFRVLFKFKEESLMEKLNFDLDNFKIPFYSVAKIEKTNDKKNMTRYSIDISTKDYRNIKFIISSDQLKFYANLNNFVFPREYSLNFTFAFKFREASYEEVSFVDGWKIYDPISEYKRQGIQFDDSEYKLRMINLNKNFTLCPTYPQILFAPKVMTDEEVKEASLFRTKNRFPVLSYVYNGVNGNKNNSSKVGYSYASIWRSSQTKSGLTGQNRSQCDEKLLKSISQLNDKLVIYDARPYINALANRVKSIS